jgi:hypothetical protein
MNGCSFDRLLQFVNNQLDLGDQLEVFRHLDRCDICREAVYKLAGDLSVTFPRNCAHRTAHSTVQQPADAADAFTGACR